MTDRLNDAIATVWRFLRSELSQDDLQDWLYNNLWLEDVMGQTSPRRSRG